MLARSLAPNTLFRGRGMGGYKGTCDERLVVRVYVDDLCCAYSHGDKQSIYGEFVKKLHD